MQDVAKRCLLYSISDFVNNCQSAVQDKFTTHSLSGLLAYVKHIYIEKYVIVCTIRNSYACSSS